MTDDAELLQDYVRNQSQTAFAELVSRHAGLVHATAVRLVRDAELARDVAQSVFIQLAVKARTIREGHALAGWLYRVTLCAAANVVRSEQRRRLREKEAMDQAELQSEARQTWQTLVPLLDESLGRLGRQDQEVLILRFLEGRSCRDVGEALALSEDAAQKRVTRALEKLRVLFAQGGVTVSSALLVAALEAGAAQAAPASLATAWAGSALACATGTGGGGLWPSLFEILLMTKTKAAILATAGVALVSTPFLMQRQEISRLREQVAVLQKADQAAASGATSTVLPAGLAGKAVPLLDWRQVESTDYQRYIANLRSIGCPEETIRDIIRADVHQLFEQKKKEYRKGAPKWNYWTSPQDFIRGSGRAMWMKLAEFDAQRDAVLRTLGVEPDQRKRVAKELNAFDLMLDFLQDDKKRAGILRLRAELDDRLQMRGLNSLDARGIERLQRELEENIRATLTPEEAFQYDLRMSSTALGLVHRLTAFEPTEQEFVSIFKLQKAFDDEFSENLSYGSGTEKARAQEAERELQSKIREMLGEERYADYTFARENTGFQEIHGIVKAAGLGAREAKRIYALREAAEQSASETRNSPNLGAEERDAALARLGKDMESSVRTLLGEAGLERLKEYGTDHAIAELSRLRVRPTPSAQAP